MNCSDVEIIHDSPDKISRNEVDATDSAEKIDGPDFSNKLDSALEPVTDRISFHRPQSPFSIKCSRPESPSTLQPLSSPGTPLLQLSVSNAIIGGQLGPLKAFGRGQGMEASAPIPTLSPVMKNSLLKSPNQISKSVDLHSSPPMINNDHSGLKATPPDNMSVDSNVATCSLSLQFDPEVLSRDVFVESCHVSIKVIFPIEYFMY